MHRVGFHSTSAQNLTDRFRPEEPPYANAPRIRLDPTFRYGFEEFMSRACRYRLAARNGSTFTPALSSSR